MQTNNIFLLDFFFLCKSIYIIAHRSVRFFFCRCHTFVSVQNTGTYIGIYNIRVAAARSTYIYFYFSFDICRIETPKRFFKFSTAGFSLTRLLGDLFPLDFSSNIKINFIRNYNNNNNHFNWFLLNEKLSQFFSPAYTFKHNTKHCLSAHTRTLRSVAINAQTVNCVLVERWRGVE